MTETYFVVHNSEGDTTITEYTEEKLTQAVNEHWWGLNVTYLTEIPAHSTDTNYWGDFVLIIKGGVAVPAPITKVTEYKLQLVN